MANKKESSEFMPTVAIPPGETIRENMEHLRMSQEELATQLDITPKYLSRIINGNSLLTHSMALKLEEIMGPSEQFWMALETNHRLNKARLRKRKDLTEVEK